MLDERDPVCGMRVDVITAYSEAVAGATYYFCSESCRVRFDADPGTFLARGRDATRGGWDASNEGSIDPPDRNPAR